MKALGILWRMALEEGADDCCTIKTTLASPYLYSTIFAFLLYSVRGSLQSITKFLASTFWSSVKLGFED